MHAMNRCLAAIPIALLVIASGCTTAERPALGPLPDPILSTRPPRALPSPRQVPLTPLPKPVPIRRAPQIGPKAIVVDPGHGGKDPGAPGVGAIPEKTVNLKIANQVAGELRARGAHVTLTRSDDRFITLNARAQQAERHNADLFVSIHADAARRASASGTTVYIARNASRQSISAAEAITAAFERAGIKCRGVQRAGYRVLVGHSRPAVLIECGFLSNPTEARLLAQAPYQSKIAAAIVDGINDHFRGANIVGR